ncbi:MAG TPA: hypothetical protein VHZ26_04500 [Caulobacteraceae bacterium]|jgi:hypothetical protein|nr:hypothetical protein [Caulobacteraceae bacterium]
MSAFRRHLEAVRRGARARAGEIACAAAGALAFAGLIAAFSLFPPRRAEAVPSFAQQTGLPCAACHVGAFGPQLKPYARDFKLFGYVNGDGRNTLPPIALVMLSSFNHTQAPQDLGVAHYGPNDNLTIDQINLIYGGALPGGAGTFAEVTYDGVHRAFTIDNLDIKRAINPRFGGHEAVLGLDLNNRPTVQDLWNSTPTWGFPYNASALAPTLAASTLLDGQLAQRVLGVGAYGMWDNTLYTEFTAYAPVANSTLVHLGVRTDPGADVYDGMLPYWRVALQHALGDDHYFEVGAYGLSAQRYPGGERSAGLDRLTDVALDGTYQFTGSDDHFVSAHATWIHEREKLDASTRLLGTNPSNHLDTVRADVSYSYKDTLTPSVQVFRTWGSHDPALYGGPGGDPSSQGYIVELAYVPLGKPGSRIKWANARFTVQYVGYSKFDGVTRGAAGHNTLYISTRIALAPFGALVQR